MFRLSEIHTQRTLFGQLHLIGNNEISKGIGKIVPEFVQLFSLALIVETLSVATSQNDAPFTTMGPPLCESRLKQG